MVELYDKIIRKEFIKRNLEFFKQKDCLFVNEFKVSSRNIVDLAFFDFSKDTLYGFEIKGSKDNLLRIERQVSTYTSLFNIVYVISAPNHVKGVIDFLNSKPYGKNVGIIEVDENLNFNEIKKAIYTFISNLDKEEVILLCEEKGVNTLGSKSTLIGRLKLKVTVEELYSSLRNKINKYYKKACESCGSSLYFNKYVGGIKNSYCYECNSIIIDY
jgi:hypothetical protein